MLGTATIEQATHLLLDAAPAGSQVFLFGSQATGKADARSDVDFLVVEPTVPDRLQEMLRLSEVLRPLKLPVDLMVLSRQHFDYWKNTPNSLAYRVVREGKVYGPAA
ncbi:MAG: nucleotidyltransferase domain-containing protein [Phycisphaerae bacterium]